MSTQEKKIIMNTPLRLGNKLDMEIKANVHNDIAHQKKGTCDLISYILLWRCMVF